MPIFQPYIAASGKWPTFASIPVFLLRIRIFYGTKCAFPLLFSREVIQDVRKRTKNVCI